MNLTTLSMADLPQGVALFGVLAGMALHVVKKWHQGAEGKNGLLRTLENWFVEGLLTTGGAFVAGIAAALGTIEMTGSLLAIFGKAIIVGIAANSVVNRPGEQP